MELTAATSVAATSMGYDDTNFLFTICLDHRMRVWDVRTGQILYTGDILNTNRDPQEVGKWIVDPSQSNLIRIVNTAQGQCLVVTYSPIGAGEFKFWRAKANNQGSVLVADLFPNHTLTPQPPSSLDVWTMADFGIAQQDEGPEIWTLWKNNFTYRVQALQLRPKSSAGPFSTGWKAVFLDSVPPAAQSSNSCDPTDATERWLDLIFFPGRFTRSTLETALAMYEKGSGSAKDTSSRGSKTLAESICAVIGSTTTLDQGSAGRMDYDQFRASSEVQWRRFYRLLIELDKQRGEALSLVVDTDLGMPWVLCADVAAAIRQCSSLDLVCHNMNAPEKSSEDVAALVKTGLDFVDNFSDGMWQLCRAALQSEMFENQAKSDEERLQYFSDKAGFWRQVTEEECNQVVDALGQNFRTVTPSLYEDLFDLLRADSDEGNRELQFAFTNLGRNVVVRATQDTADLHWQILFSQLILLVHMEFEFDNEEDALHSRFDVGAIYRKIIAALRRLEHVKWMAKTEMNAPAMSASRRSSVSGTSSPTSKRSRDEPQVITALEGILGHLLGLSEAESQPLMASITNVVTNLCAYDSDIDLLPYLHQCFLLKADRPDLALQLSPFAEQDAFSTYIQGRVFLALQDYDTAALYFKKAAIGLSKQYRYYTPRPKELTNIYRHINTQHRPPQRRPARRHGMEPPQQRPAQVLLAHNQPLRPTKSFLIRHRLCPPRPAVHQPRRPRVRVAQLGDPLPPLLGCDDHLVLRRGPLGPAGHEGRGHAEVVPPQAGGEDVRDGPEQGARVAALCRPAGQGRRDTARQVPPGPGRGEWRAVPPDPVRVAGEPERPPRRGGGAARPAEEAEGDGRGGQVCGPGGRDGYRRYEAVSVVDQCAELCGGGAGFHTGGRAGADAEQGWW